MLARNQTKIDLPEDWLQQLRVLFQTDNMRQLRAELAARYQSKIEIFPKKGEYFAAFKKTSLKNLKVIILGQDPYHGANQANGLSFSVNKGIPLPPSLRNIYIELESDLGVPPASHGDLSCWAEQGVLLLNSVLTVERASPGSHAKIGWEWFTDRVIQTISSMSTPCVFILWGKFAQSKIDLIDQSKHLVVATPHPSPFSAHRGFFGSKPFSRANHWLVEHRRNTIDWSIQ